MKQESLKSRVFNEKCWLIKGKIAKSAVSFHKNKPNSPIVQTDVTSFITMNYPIFTSLTKVKNKPNQTQYKPKTNPIAEKAIINISSFMTSKYEKVSCRRVKKTNPIQTQFRNYSGIQSSPERLFIKRMNRKQLQKDFPDFFPETSRYGLDRLRQIKYIIKLNFSCTNRITMKQHFDAGFIEKICKED